MVLSMLKKALFHDVPSVQTLFKLTHADRFLTIFFLHSNLTWHVTDSQRVQFF